jgi:N,N'-diacetyllegionaminate synthase
MIINHVIVIAEAGVNHNGDLQLAIKLIDEAANAGADYVKFQTFKTENLVNAFAKKAIYQKHNTNDGDDTQYKMLKKLEISEDWYPKLIDRCREKNIKFLSTGFDEESIDFLDVLQIPFYKIPSGEITNKPFLRHIARKGKKIILSTGMASLKEVADALEILNQEGVSKENIIVLHCNTEYPTPMEHVNLLAMKEIALKLGVKVGYSDHTMGIEIPIAAVALGACVVEKHFTLDRNMKGPDHAASLEPKELSEMVKAIRNIELALSGNGIKEPSASEEKNILLTRKSIVAKKIIQKGEIFSEINLTTKRPGTGISPMEWDNILGQVAKRDYNLDDFIIKD